MPNRNRTAFTLIELLVVLAVIAILSAILFPVFAVARAKARTTACLSNTKQLAAAMLMYTTDYDDRTPIIWRYYEDPNFYGWQQRTYSYVKNNDVFVCNDGPKCVPLNIMSPVLSGGGGNFACNAHLAPSIHLAQAERPAELFLVTETGVADWLGNGTSVRSADTTLYWGAANTWAGLRCQQYYDAYDPIIVQNSLWAFAINFRHQGGANFVFGDGHAKRKMKGTLRPENVYVGTPPDEAYVPCTLK